MAAGFLFKCSFIIQLCGAGVNFPLGLLIVITFPMAVILVAANSPCWYLRLLPSSSYKLNSISGPGYTSRVMASTGFSSTYFITGWEGIMLPAFTYRGNESNGVTTFQ